MIHITNDDNITYYTALVSAELPMFHVGRRRCIFLLIDYPRKQTHTTLSNPQGFFFPNNIPLTDENTPPPMDFILLTT